jgi:hypothetical protein
MTAVDEYLLHGLRLRVHCGRATARDAIRARLLPYWIPTTVEHDGALVDVTIGRRGAIVDDMCGGRPVYDSSIADVMYDDATDRLTVDARDQAQAIVEPARRCVRMSVLRDDDKAWALCAHPLLTLALLELMKARGLYSLHAGGVTVGERAILIPGASGAGKSTLTAALLRRGTGFLSDDMVFLGPVGPEVEALSFADQLDVTDTTAAMFTNLADLVGAPLPPGRPKHHVRAEERFGSTRVDRARPAVLLLPKIVEGARSSLRNADPLELLAALAPNVLLTHPARSQRHLDTLATLVDTVPAYRLAVGSDLGAAAELVLSTIG